MAEPTKLKNISIRPTAEDLTRLAALRDAIEATGVTARESTVARDAFSAGLDVLEARFRKSRRAR